MFTEISKGMSQVGSKEGLNKTQKYEWDIFTGIKY